MSRFDKLLLVGLALLALALWLTWYSARRPADVPEAQVRQDDSTGRKPAPTRWGSRTLADSADFGVETDEQEEATDWPNHDGHGSIRQFTALTRYPSSSRRLTKDSTDLLNPNKRHERRRPVPDPDGNEALAWEVRYTADRYFVRGTEPVVVSLALWHEGESVVPQGVTMVAQRPGASTSAESVTLPIQRDGSELTATFVPNEQWPAHVGEVRVTTKFSAPGLREQTGSLAFYFTGTSRIPAEFTGRFTDEVSEGDLVIDVGIEVATAGTYRIEGNLFDTKGNAIGWARFDGDLTPGPGSVPLVFYGLIFHDADVQAPFVLRQVRGYRLRRGESPHREDVPTYDGQHQTSSYYALSDFDDQVHDSPRKQRMLEHYQDALDRGVQLTEPQFVGAGHQQ